MNNKRYIKFIIPAVFAVGVAIIISVLALLSNKERGSANRDIEAHQTKGYKFIIETEETSVAVPGNESGNSENEGTVIINGIGICVGEDTLSRITDMGFTIPDKGPGIIRMGQRKKIEVSYEGADLELDCTAVSECELKDTVITGITITALNADQYIAIFPRDITLASNAKDMLAAYGDSCSKYESDSITEYWYGDDRGGMRFTFLNFNGEMAEMSLWKNH